MKKSPHFLLLAVFMIFVLGVGSAFADSGGSGRTEGPSIE